MRRSSWNRPSQEAPRKEVAASGLCVAFLLLAVTVVACRPGGPTGVASSSSVASVTVSPETVELPVGGRVRLEATVRDDEGVILPEEPVTWTSSDPSVATVDEQGEVSGVAPGTATVSASSQGVSGTATVDVRGFLIGSAGGVVASVDGRAWAAVPPGALSEQALVTIDPARASVLPDGAAAEGFTPGSAYALQSGAQAFSRTVELTIRYDPAAIPPRVPESSLRLRRASDGQWVQMPGSSVDPEAGEVRGGVDRSGVYGAVGVVPRNPPTATITSPNDGAVRLRGQPITFEGTGSDPEDGTLEGESLVWSSDRDGEIGTGRSVTTSALSSGQHTITLMVTDSDGDTDADQIGITIVGL